MPACTPKAVLAISCAHRLCGHSGVGGRSGCSLLMHAPVDVVVNENEWKHSDNPRILQHFYEAAGYGRIEVRVKQVGKTAEQRHIGLTVPVGRRPAEVDLERLEHFRKFVQQQSEHAPGQRDVDWLQLI